MKIVCVKFLFMESLCAVTTRATDNRVSELKSVLEDIVRSALVETVWCSAEHLDHFTLADLRGH